ncbi:MAG TPA: hypothetical protein LFV92_06940 [Rickettsia endosymbiont of Ceroptres masudai]|nr:hypothetical protein [Rickettsia endosymbiont of Ceroptres masudai]
MTRLPCRDYVPPRKPLLRRPVKPTVSPRGLTTGSIKTIKNTNNFSIFNWILGSSRRCCIARLCHSSNGGNPVKKHKYGKFFKLKARFISLYAGFPPTRE